MKPPTRFRLFRSSRIAVTIDGALSLTRVDPPMLRLLADALSIAQSGRPVTIQDRMISWPVKRKPTAQETR